MGDRSFVTIVATHNNRDGWTEVAGLLLAGMVALIAIHLLYSLLRRGWPWHLRLINLAVSLFLLASLPTVYGATAAIGDTCPAVRDEYEQFGRCYSWGETVGQYFWPNVLWFVVLLIPYGILAIIIVAVHFWRASSDRSQPDPAEPPEQVAPPGSGIVWEVVTTPPEDAHEPPTTF